MAQAFPTISIEEIQTLASNSKDKMTSKSTKMYIKFIW